MNESLFKKVENKTNIKKETIISLANKLKSNIKDEKTITSVIDELSLLTGKTLSNEKKQKLINTIINDKVPNNIDNSF